MKISKVLAVKPTDRKVKKAKQALKDVTSGVLPKEMPIEKKIYIRTQADNFEQIKDSIQLSIDNMKK